MIRRSVLEDADWIRDVAAEVYEAFGDYRQIIPAWLAYPGVLAFVETDDDGVRRGFILVAFYEPPDLGRKAFVADLLAIGVAPQYQGQGVGQRLLAFAIEFAEGSGKNSLVPEIRLTVADTNHRARALFMRCGFDVLDENHGQYDRGQRAIRMRRRL